MLQCCSKLPTKNLQDSFGKMSTSRQYPRPIKLQSQGAAGNEWLFNMSLGDYNGQLKLRAIRECCYLDYGLL